MMIVMAQRFERTRGNHARGAPRLPALLELLDVGQGGLPVAQHAVHLLLSLGHSAGVLQPTRETLSARGHTAG
jgi:hypothetical protein